MDVPPLRVRRADSEGFARVEVNTALMKFPQKLRSGLVASALALLMAACTAGVTESGGQLASIDDATTTVESGDATAEIAPEPDGQTTTFRAEVWADNWFALYANGELVGEDSVPITTERSFNSETFMFEATYPLTIAIEAKDFIETDSGLEYIGEGNQQMGDGGIIAQITDEATGEVVAVTNSSWTALVVHQAPLNADCVDDPDPDATCENLIIDVPSGWTNSDFDDSAWPAATEWNAAAVGPKGGYDDLGWEPTAQFIWGTDLQVDNTALFRLTVSDG